MPSKSTTNLSTSGTNNASSSGSNTPPSTMTHTAVPIIPMPTPGTGKAPYFKGKRVTDFLDSLEVHASAAQVAFSFLLSHILRYCHSSVRKVVENDTCISGVDWQAVRDLFTNLYSSSNKTPTL